MSENLYISLNKGKKYLLTDCAEIRCNSTLTHKVINELNRNSIPHAEIEIDDEKVAIIFPEKYPTISNGYDTTKMINKFVARINERNILPYEDFIKETPVNISRFKNISDAEIEILKDNLNSYKVGIEIAENGKNNLICARENISELKKELGKAKYILEKYPEIKKELEYDKTEKEKIYDVMSKLNYKNTRAVDFYIFARENNYDYLAYDSQNKVFERKNFQTNKVTESVSLEDKWFDAKTYRMIEGVKEPVMAKKTTIALEGIEFLKNQYTDIPKVNNQIIALEMQILDNVIDKVGEGNIIDIKEQVEAQVKDLQDFFKDNDEKVSDYLKDEQKKLQSEQELEDFFDTVKKINSNIEVEDYNKIDGLYIVFEEEKERDNIQEPFQDIRREFYQENDVEQ